MDDPLVYLSVAGRAEMVPLSEARVPVLDRGFIFGDGIYEVVPVYARVPFRLAQHLARLSRSLGAIGIVNPFDTDGWKTRIAELIAGFDAEDQLVYIQVTRGVAKRAHAFPKGVIPTVFMMTGPLVPVQSEVRKQGASAVTAADNRWLRCDIKSTSLLGNVLMAQNAAEQGVVETILFRDGLLSEASSSNVWVVSNGVLYAPPKDERILEGIRYGLIAELAATYGLRFEIRPITKEQVHAADEVMLTSATKEVLAVVQLDGRPVGRGVPGPVYARLYTGYQDAKSESRLAAQAPVKPIVA